MAAVARNRTSHAISSSNRVLPTPAGPATISPAPRTARRTAASSASLPTNGHPMRPGQVMRAGKMGDRLLMSLTCGDVRMAA